MLNFFINLFIFYNIYAILTMINYVNIKIRGKKYVC